MITPEEITRDFIIGADAANVVWVRWDYLAMRGIEDRPDVLAVLDRVWELKTEMANEGVLFSS